MVSLNLSSAFLFLAKFLLFTPLLDHPDHLFWQILKLLQKINQVQQNKQINKQVKRPVIVSDVLPRMVVVKRSFTCSL